MIAPVNHLPSTASLRAFASVARHLNMTRAAEELHLSQSAVSQQIKALEDNLGVDLFRRVGRRLVLTEPGQRYVAHSNKVLEMLAAASEDMWGFHHCGNLTISVCNVFAHRWLMSRIGQFCERFPDINLRFSTSDGPVDFAAQDVDLAIRYGGSEWKHGNAAPFLCETVFPVCSAGLKEKLRDLEHPSDILRAPLLIDGSATNAISWDIWLKHMRVDVPAKLNGVVFQDTAMLLSAAAAGHGIALARGALVADELRTGMFIKLFQEEVRIPQAYWIMSPETSNNRTKPEKFKRWLCGEAARLVEAVNGVAVYTPSEPPVTRLSYDHDIPKWKSFQL